MNKRLDIVSLYPREMNIYGDRGNVLAVINRAREHGYDPHITEVNTGDELPDSIDLIIGGGGQDSGQLRVMSDLSLKGERLRNLAVEGVPMLMICGLFQLFGRHFVTHTGQKMPGIGVLDIETTGGQERVIGNVILHSEHFGEVIGFENHSGQTTLGSNTQPLGRVLQGVGNNADDGVEGALMHNVIGSYLHGSLLPKNPAITDFLVGTAARRRYGSFEPAEIDDTTAQMARESAKRRPR